MFSSHHSNHSITTNIIQSPKTPYAGTIFGGVNAGTQIIVEGHVPTWWTRQFTINLVLDHDDYHVKQADIALHVNPRFDEKYMVLNSRAGGLLMYEQRNVLPIRKGEDFLIAVLVEMCVSSKSRSMVGTLPALRIVPIFVTLAFSLLMGTFSSSA